MNRTSSVLALALFAGPGWAQTDVLQTIERPDHILHGWGATLFALPDLDGDGVGELAIGTREHGGGEVFWIHSGRSGAFLFSIVEPHVSLFWGGSIAATSDRNGDGVPDLVVVGTHSGAHDSPDGWIQIHSGATGELLLHLEPPAGFLLRENEVLALEDQDGDGIEDVLCRTVSVPGEGRPELQLFSTATGAPLFQGVVDDAVQSIGNKLARVEDHDGDGVDDFVSTGTDGNGPRVDVRSGRTGQVIRILRGAGIGLLTNNNEPITSTPDIDGDGLRDLAVGNHFEWDSNGGIGMVRSFSSVSGALHRRWESIVPGSEFGFRLISPGDLNLDGQGDLMTLEFRRLPDGTIEGTAFVGLDLDSSTPVFEELIPALGGIFVASLAVLPGVDPDGFPSFADFEGEEPSVLLRRYAQEVGTRFCTSTENSTGEAATIRALGSGSIATDRFLLEARDAVPTQFGIFFYGPDEVQVPFGQGFRCVGGGATGLGRLPVTLADDAGRLAHFVDFSDPPTGGTQITAGSTWSFQAWFRDPALGGPAFQTSDGTTVTFAQ